MNFSGYLRLKLFREYNSTLICKDWGVLGCWIFTYKVGARAVACSCQCSWPKEKYTNRFTAVNLEWHFLCE